MKKMYIKPSVEMINIQMESIIALSTQATEITNDTKGDFENLGREDNGPSAPGVWDSEW